MSFNNNNSSITPHHQTSIDQSTFPYPHPLTQKKTLKVQKKQSNKRGNYILGETIGKGAFAKVKIATHIQTKQKVAIKILSKQNLLSNQNQNNEHNSNESLSSKSLNNLPYIDRIKKEINIIKQLKHKNIIQLYEIMESPSSLYIVMEYCEGKELFDYIIKRKHLSEREACRFFQQIINGVEYLHIMNVTHRDLKPENLLLDNKKRIKITDFGLSSITKFYDSFLSTPCGTPSYAPPEMLRGNEYNGVLSDIYSCGIILYTMLCGNLPCADSREEIIYQTIVTHNYDYPSYVSKSAINLIENMIKVEPTERFNFQQIKSHPWFNMVKPQLKPGILVGIMNIPVDENIIKMIEGNAKKEGFSFNSEVCRNNLKENKCDSVSALYYLTLKQAIKEGNKSISDLYSDIYLNYIKNLDNWIIPEVISNIKFKDYWLTDHTLNKSQFIKETVPHKTNIVPNLKKLNTFVQKRTNNISPPKTSPKNIIVNKESSLENTKTLSKISIDKMHIENPENDITSPSNKYKLHKNANMISTTEKKKSVLKQTSSSKTNKKSSVPSPSPLINKNNTNSKFNSSFKTKPKKKVSFANSSNTKIKPKQFILKNNKKKLNGTFNFGSDTLLPANKEKLISNLKKKSENFQKQFNIIENIYNYPNLNINSNLNNNEVPKKNKNLVNQIADKLLETTIFKNLLINYKSKNKNLPIKGEIVDKFYFAQKYKNLINLIKSKKINIFENNRYLKNLTIDSFNSFLNNDDNQDFNFTEHFLKNSMHGPFIQKIKKSLMIQIKVNKSMKGKNGHNKNNYSVNINHKRYSSINRTNKSFVESNNRLNSSDISNISNNYLNTSNNMSNSAYYTRSINNSEINKFNKNKFLKISSFIDDYSYQGRNKFPRNIKNYKYNNENYLVNKNNINKINKLNINSLYNYNNSNENVDGKESDDETDNFYLNYYNNIKQFNKNDMVLNGLNINNSENIGSDNYDYFFENLRLKNEIKNKKLNDIKYKYSSSSVGGGLSEDEDIGKLIGINKINNLNSRINKVDYGKNKEDISFD